MNNPLAELPDTLHGYKSLQFDTLDSTSEEAKRLVQAGKIEKTVILSRTQTKGHGRYGRQWVSPPGNLYASLLLPIDRTFEEVAQLSFVVAVAVGEMLASVFPKSASITYKWPNDVLVNDKKVAGILLESSSQGGKTQASWIIIGIGLNIENIPQVVDKPVICIKDILGRLLNKYDDPVGYFADAFVARFAEQLQRWESGGFATIQERWMQRVWSYNKPVVVKSGKILIKGICRGINAEGELMLDSDEGNQHCISTGEVFWGNEELSVDHVISN